MDIEKVQADILIVLNAFEDGLFIWDITRDHESDWSIKIYGPLAALARLREFAEKGEG